MYRSVEDSQSLRGNEKGAAAMEGVFVLPFFLMLLVITIEFMTVCYVQLTLQFTLSRVARIHSVDQTVNVVAEINQNLNTFGVGLDQDDVITVCPRTSACPAGTIQNGMPRDPMMYRVDRAVSMFAFGVLFSRAERWNFDVSAVVFGRNEP